MALLDYVGTFFRDHIFSQEKLTPLSVRKDIALELKG